MLECLSDGFPTPTLTWKKQDGNELKKVTAEENTVKVVMKADQDFGLYTCNADNGIGAPSIRTVQVQQIKAPGSPIITSTATDIEASSLTIRWNAPAEDGGSPITAYRVVILQGDNEIMNTNITDPAAREKLIERLNRDSNYNVKVYARNYVFEGGARQKDYKTNFEVLTPPPESKADSSFGKEKLFHIVYITVIVVLLVSVLTLVVVLWRMRSRLEMLKLKREGESGTREEHIAMVSIANQEEPDDQPLVVEPQREETNYSTPFGADYMPLHPSTRSWELNRKQVNVIKIIGKGAFSEVAKATIWNFREDQKYITVAAKMLKANAPESDRKDLLSELELMTKLKPHPHVIKLIGCVTESDPLLVLIEFVPFGDLLGYLRKSRGLNDTYFKDPDVKPQTSLTAQQLMRFAWQVADGMCYLSSKKIIHRDLAARNVLVGEREKCKVTDFGMARNLHHDDIYSRKSWRRLPVKWTAYEALLFGIYTTQSDVWSYGILLYEIITVGGCPYPDIHIRQIAQKLQEGYRMPKPTHVDSKLYEIMLKCWEEQPNDRPKFEKLRKTMKEMEKNHKTYVNLSQYDESLYANVKDLADE